MKGRHQIDLIWRFQVADHQMVGIPSALEVLRKQLELCRSHRDAHRSEVGVLMTDANLAARERAERIDRILARLPGNYARVLYLRYGPEEHRVSLREVLPHISGVATLTEAAHAAFERDAGRRPRSRSNDVVQWLEGLCHRIAIREPQGDDKAVLADILAETDELLTSAENTYEARAERLAA